MGKEWKEEGTMVTEGVLSRESKFVKMLTKEQCLIKKMKEVIPQNVIEAI